MRHIKARIKKKKKPLTLLTNTKLLHSKSTYFYKQWDSYLIPAGCAIALLLVLSTAINPITSAHEEAFAADDDLLNPSLSLGFNNGNGISESILAESGKVAYITNNVKVSAVKVDGYQVFVQAASGSSNSLSGQIPTNTLKITGVGTDVTPDNFEDNKWGYTLDEGANLTPSTLTYSTLPSSDNTTPDYATTANTETKDFTLAFAAKFGSDATADHYKTNVLLSVAAGAKEVAGFNELFLGFDSITYMQDMTSAICAAAKVNETKQLIDRRDNKKYWVTKLQDQNCWMSQNLDLDLNEANLLTSANSDVSSNWPSSAVSKTLWNTAYGDSYYNITRYYDPGEYVYATPSIQRDCDTVTSLSQCSEYGFISIAGLTADGDPNFTTKMDGDAVGGNRYDAHYLVGNYYTYNAATAGTSYANETSASKSICPKGWRLPLGGSNNNTTSKSFYYLLNQYGVRSSLVSTTTTNKFDIRLSPLFLVYGGMIGSKTLNNTTSPKISSLIYAGAYGYYSTSMTGTSGSIASLHFATSVSPASGANGYSFYGYSIRCVAR